MNKKVILVPCALALLLGGGYWVDRTRRAKESVLSGTFESQPTIASSRLGGRVEKILVREGDTVKAGEELVRLEASAYATTAEAQQMGAEQARQQLEETTKGPRVEDVDRARHAVEEAQAALDKLKNGARPEEVAAARAQAAAADAQYRKVMSGARPEEVAASRAAANIALAKLQQVERGLTAEERGQLRARLDGAIANEVLAKKQLDRTQFLYGQGAVSKQALDQATAAFQQASSVRRDAEGAVRRAQRGAPREELAQAQAAYRQAQAQFELVRSGSRKEDIESALHQVQVAQANLSLVVKGPREEDLRAAQARLDQAQSGLTELQNGSRKEEIGRADAAHRQASLVAKSTEQTLAERRVLALADGVVDRMLVAAGDLVPSGGPVVQISYPTDIWLRIYLPEALLAKVKVGDEAELAIDGVDETLTARVESIASRGEFTPANLQAPEERGKQVFGVRIRLANPDSRVKAGMVATVRRIGQWP